MVIQRLGCLRRLCYFVFSLVFCVCAFAQGADRVAALPPLSSADALGAELFERSVSTGMVLVLVRGDEVFFRGYGETAPGSGQVPTPESLLRLCSLSKIFATDLLVKLALAHIVRLDDSLQRFAPLGARVPFRGKPITLADLATHTAGIPREVEPAPRGVPHFTFPDYDTRWRWLPAQHLRSTTGTAALYSNAGFDLLGDALQVAAHKPYPQLLAEQTLTPLHLRQTTFFPTPPQCARLLGTAKDEGPCTSTEATAASSGLYSTAADMAQWLKYLLRSGTPAQHSAAQAVYLLPSNLTSVQGLNHAGEPTGIGLGWMHLLAPDDPSHLVEKTGGGAGFVTYIALNHARDTALFVAFTEGRGSTRFNVFKAANDLLLAVCGLPPMPPEPARPPARPPNRVARRHRPA